MRWDFGPGRTKQDKIKRTKKLMVSVVEKIINFRQTKTESLEMKKEFEKYKILSKKLKKLKSSPSPKKPQ